MENVSSPTDAVTRLRKRLAAATLFIGAGALGFSAKVFAENPGSFFDRLIDPRKGAVAFAVVWITSSAIAKFEYFLGIGTRQVTPALGTAIFTFYFTLFSLKVEERLDIPVDGFFSWIGMSLIFVWVALWHLVDLRNARVI